MRYRCILLDRIKSGAQLIIVGDADQLPSVGAGNVLREMIRSEKVPTAVLETVFRQASNSRIITNAYAINHNDTHLQFGDDFQFLEVQNSEEAAQLVIKNYLQEVSLHGIEDVQILSPLRKRGAVAANALNEAIRDLVNPPNNLKKEVKCGSRVFRVGDRIMQTANRINVSNGDVGVITDMKKEDDETITCVRLLDGRTLQYTQEMLEDLEFSYCTTIHKSQGQEYPVIIVPLLKEHYIMLRRNLLYTAVTRAKAKVILIGQKQAVFVAIHKCDVGQRNTVLADRIVAYYCDVNLHTAYEELCKIFGPDGGEPVRKCKRKPRSIETVELPIASAEVRDNTYSNLLSLLTLCPTHQSALKERGLKSEEMERLCYRTTPTTRLKRIVTELLERGCILDGVPGFYCQKDSGQWVLDIRGSGIMLPDRNLLGQIEAIQVRLDKVYNQKFYNLTSVDQYYGTQSKCCPHYVGVHEGDEVVCLTEGVMKSDLAYSFAQGSPYECGFVGLTGIPSYSQYERALEELDSIGVKRINVMVDSDYQVKEEVRKARDRYIEMGAAAGFEVAPITWAQKRKGVDDLYKHLFRNK